MSIEDETKGRTFVLKDVIADDQREHIERVREWLRDSEMNFYKIFYDEGSGNYLTF
jgi:hypothetical protein